MKKLLLIPIFVLILSGCTKPQEVSTSQVIKDITQEVTKNPTEKDNQQETETTEKEEYKEFTFTNKNVSFMYPPNFEVQGNNGFPGVVVKSTTGDNLEISVFLEELYPGETDGRVSRGYEKQAFGNVPVYVNTKINAAYVPFSDDAYLSLQIKNAGENASNSDISTFNDLLKSINTK